MNIDIEEMTVNFQKNGYAISVFDTGKDAVEYLCQQIQNECVGFGDSHTLLELDLYDRLQKNNQVLDPQHTLDFMQTAKACLSAGIFITSANAASLKGELVNLDGTGNRVSGSLFGHKKVYFVLGINKVVQDLEQAIWRTRNIAAPKNAQRLKVKTPCALRADRCYDCSSPERICNGLVVYLKKMHDMDMEVVLVKQKLGY